MRFAALFIASILLPTLILAQGSPRFQIGAGPTVNWFYGDLQPEDERIHRPYAGMNIALQFNNPKFIGPQINAGFGSYRVQDRLFDPEIPAGEDVEPNTFASSNFFYLDFMLRIRPLKRRLFRPHGGVGIGLFNFNPKNVAGEELVNLPDTRLPQEEYNTTTGMLPLNVGFTWAINDLVSVGMDYYRHVVFSDYLDNVGELGTRSGGDGLNSLQIMVYLTPSYLKRRGRGGR